MYVCIYIYMYVYIYIYVCIYVSIYIYILINKCIVSHLHFGNWSQRDSRKTIKTKQVWGALKSRFRLPQFQI